jgi:hypothetical protein
MAPLLKQLLADYAATGLPPLTCRPSPFADAAPH